MEHNLDKEYEEYIKRPREENFSPFSELCHFAEEAHLDIRLEKPFDELDGFQLQIYDPDENEIEKVNIPDINQLDERAGSLLNKLSQKWVSI